MTTNHHPNVLRSEGDLAAFAASLPIISFDQLYHVGTMDPADKGRFASLEGDGLSVSVHPQEWIAIARLGGNPTWALTKDPNRFLRYHALGEHHHNTVAAWAVEHGYAHHATLWHVTWDDDEGGPVSIVVDSEAAADEAELRGEDDESVTVHTETGLVATAALAERLGQHCHLGVVADLVWVAFVGEHADALDLDGIWWDDRHDPAALSCPRASSSPHESPRSPQPASRRDPYRWSASAGQRRCDPHPPERTPMDLIDLALCGPSLILGTDHGVREIPDGLLDAALDTLGAAAREADGGSVDAQLVVARTFDRKGNLSAEDPCGRRNPSYSRGDDDGYLIGLFVHFESHHRPLADQRAALDVQLAEIGRARTEAEVADLTAELDALDATRARVAGQLETARAALETD